MQKILQKIQTAIQTMLKPNGSSAKSPPVEVARLQKLAEMLEMTREGEQGCEDVYEVIDQYADLMARGEDAGILMPLVQHHLSICNGCCEEYEMLLDILQMEQVDDDG
jgi:hypothetical protein